MRNTEDSLTPVNLFFNHEKHERTRNFCFLVAVVTTEHTENTEISFYCAKSRVNACCTDFRLSSVDLTDRRAKT